jgi:hypothetical protein
VLVALGCAEAGYKGRHTAIRNMDMHKQHHVQPKLQGHSKTRGGVRRRQQRLQSKTTTDSQVPSICNHNIP